jgi:hypothetical protein
MTIVVCAVAPSRSSWPARCRGIATGISTMAEDIAPKKIGLMREAVPGLARLAVLKEASPGGIQQGVALVASANSVDLESKALPPTDPTAFDRFFSEFAAAPWRGPTGSALGRKAGALGSAALTFGRSSSSVPGSPSALSLPGGGPS